MGSSVAIFGHADFDHGDQLHKKKTEEMKNQSQLVKFLPLMIGYISLTVPAGLAMYWLFNNVFTTLTQVYLRNFMESSYIVEASDDILIKIPLGCAVIDDSFERVPNDEVETYLETNPSVIWNEEWLEEWRQQQAQEISESLEKWWRRDSRFRRRRSGGVVCGKIKK